MYYCCDLRVKYISVGSDCLGSADVSSLLFSGSCSYGMMEVLLCYVFQLRR